MRSVTYTGPTEIIGRFGEVKKGDTLEMKFEEWMAIRKSGDTNFKIGPGPKVGNVVYANAYNFKVAAFRWKRGRLFNNLKRRQIRELYVIIRGLVEVGFKIDDPQAAGIKDKGTLAETICEHVYMAGWLPQYPAPESGKTPILVSGEVKLDNKGSGKKQSAKKGKGGAYSDLTVKELKAELKKRGVSFAEAGTPGVEGSVKEALTKLLKKDDRQRKNCTGPYKPAPPEDKDPDCPPEDEDPKPDPEPDCDYPKWKLDKLKDECEKRGLKLGKGENPRRKKGWADCLKNDDKRKR